MSDDLNHYVPRRLDDPPKFLFWSVDVATIALVGLILGVLAGYILVGLGMGVALALAWQKFSSGKHPGMAAHVIYWVIGWPEPKKLPPSHLREFNG
ncbi:type IV conjugative transfer system protein TraL (plasmid) [Burkholderia thailandensis]|jgi:conjugal transfer pilus assembly protein TraL|uniref:type IV conjugative transfer system protein TraL n=1 Tax=Burkholderia thailandensis TaxID=57975 RepID=UPI00192E0AA1|nr:type IV conjugative transfer system protein TraL [Burkholderia thailandensis]MBS2132348.1 type IV conjugative transfer system protein TraL [Burkholderia thailandensis]QRA15153.1 type IV conjugative transfer system protein TraL [Burkholderia thailandensis]